MGEGFTGGVCTRTFFISELILTRDFLPVVSKLSQSSLVRDSHLSDEL